MGFFLKIAFDVWLISPTHRANSSSNPRPIVHFAEELQCFVCDRTTPLIIKKIRSKGVAMHAYGVSVYRKSIKCTWVEPFKMNAKIEREPNFVLDIESHRFFDA